MIQARREKAAHRIVHRVDDGLCIVVERRVQQHSDTGQLSEFVNELPECRVRAPGHGLRSRGVIDVRGCPEQLTCFRFHAECERHERRRRDASGQLEVLSGALLEDCGRERAVSLALLHHRVDQLLVARGTRVGEDTAIAERTRTELRSTLDPADHLAVSEQRCRTTRHLRFVLNVDQCVPLSQCGADFVGGAD